MSEVVYQYKWNTAPSDGLIPLRGKEGSDYVALLAFTIISGRIFFLFTREKEGPGSNGKTYPKLEKFPGGEVLVDDNSLPEAANRELGEETGIFDVPLEITWLNTIYAEMPNEEGPGVHRKIFFVVRMDRPKHPDMQRKTAAAIEDAFWAELSPKRQFPIQLPKAHREALDFARQNAPVFQVPVNSSRLDQTEEGIFLAQVRTVEPWSEKNANSLVEGEVQPLLEDGLTPFQRKELEKQEARMKARRRR